MRKNAKMGPKAVKISGSDPEVRVRHDKNPERGFSRHHKSRSRRHR